MILKSKFETFKTKGVDIVFGPVESPPKDAMFGFIRDPSGVLIELIEKKQELENTTLNFDK